MCGLFRYHHNKSTIIIMLMNLWWLRLQEPPILTRSSHYLHVLLASLHVRHTKYVFMNGAFRLHTKTANLAELHFIHAWSRASERVWRWKLWFKIKINSIRHCDTFVSSAKAQCKRYVELTKIMLRRHVITYSSRRLADVKRLWHK